MSFQLKRFIPAPIKSVLKALGFNKVKYMFADKYKAELVFQKEWAKEFKDNKPKVLEYWEKYRYLDQIKKICEINNNMKVLDVGCGISTVLHFIDGQRYGIDPLADEYKKLYSYPDQINIQKGFGEEIPFPVNYFDVIFCSNVIDHVTCPQKTIDEIYNALKPASYFIFTVELFVENRDRDPAHPHSITKKDVYSLIEDKYEILFTKESPWLGLRNYVNGLNTCDKKELIMVLKKI